MGTTRSYADACPIARALDVIGERWALLVIRELLLGPQRFSDLRHALAGASTNILTDRLRELERHGLVQRRRLPPPAASLVYELTAHGQRLGPTLEALGTWGATVPTTSEQSRLTATSVLLFLRGCLRGAQPPLGVYRVQLDDSVWTIRTTAARAVVQPGDPAEPDAELRTDPRTLNTLIAEPNALDPAVASGAVTIAGNIASLRRLLRAASEAASLTAVE